MVEHSTAWGNNVLDQNNLHTGNCVTFDTILASPIDGEWFCAIVSKDVSGTSVKQSKLSLEFSDTLSIYKWYELSFYDKAPMGPPPPGTYYDPVKYKLGISLVPDAFGDSIYTSPYPGAAWVQRKIIFQAPNNGRHLTIKAVLMRVITLLS